MADKDKFKPLPKPVAAPSRVNRQTPPAPAPQRQAPPQQNINTDDFEIPNRTLRTGKRKRPPTLAEAVVIFFKRLFKKIRLFFVKKTDALYVPTAHTRQATKEARMRQLRKQKMTRMVGFACLAVVLVAFAILLLLRLTGDNAYAVYFEGQETAVIGYVAMSEDIDGEKIHTQAVARLEESLGAKVQTDQTVMVEAVNKSAKDISEYEALVDLVTRSFTYKIAATALFVKGEEVVVLKTPEEAQAVADRLQSPYVGDNTESASFVEEFRPETKMVDADELGTIDDALLQLDTNHRSLEDYVIQQGETLSGIAIKNNTTVDKITENTPGLTDPSRIQPGDIIKLEMTKPYLSVKTVDVVTRKKVIPMQTTIQENASQPSTYKKIIQEGREGEMEETVRITRVNGVLSQPEEVIDSKQTIDPITRVEEIGVQ